MSNFSRIHRRHPANPANIEAAGKRVRRRGVTVYRDISPAGRHYYHDGDHVPASLPYVSPFRVKKPYVRPEDRRNPEGRHG